MLSWHVAAVVSPLELFAFLGQTMRRVFFGYCYPMAYSHRHSLLIHVLFPTRGVPKLCWEAANPLRCKHICRGTLVEDGCQPAPALQAAGDQ